MWMVLGFPLAAAASVDVLLKGGVSLCGIGNGCFGVGSTMCSPKGVLFCAKSSEEKGLVWTSSADFAVKGEGPAFGRALFSVFYLPLILAD
jgi:hypothetical protein